VTTLKPPVSVSSTALFRYGVVSEVLSRVARGQLYVEAVRAVAERTHHAPAGPPRKVGRRSLYRWLAAYRDHGLAGLENKARTCKSDGVLAPALVGFLVAEKIDDPRASVPELLRRAVAAGLLHEVGEVDRTTAWRALKRRHIQTRRLPVVRDQRRFCYPHRLQMVMCDGKHFRAGKTHAKRVVLLFIDDCTRYIPVCVVGASESAELFLRGLHRLLLAVGRIDSIYVDLGSGFRNHDVESVLANLEIAHVLGTPGYPQARGKIERFNQTIKKDLLRHLARDDVDPDFTSLELRIEHHLRTEYNVTPHVAHPKDVTPRARFEADERPLEPYVDLAGLREHFFTTVTRRVSNDHIVSIDGLHWEVPRGLARQEVAVRQDVFDPLHLLLQHEGRTLRLAQVDLTANARAHRARGATPEPPSQPKSQGAALASANQALAPITQPDGGFPAQDQE